MNNLRLTARFSLILLVFFSLNTDLFSRNRLEFSHFAAKNLLINTIEGQVWDNARQPVANLYVELLNDVYSTVARTKTNAGGRFTFTRISSGHFKVKISTTGTNFLEYSEDVEVVNIFQGSSDSVYLNIYLKPDPRKTDAGVKLINESIFVQNIPPEALKLYRKGSKLLDDKPELGFAEIEQSLLIYPEYFDALKTLGIKYTERGEFQKALPYLIKSLDINNKDYSIFYALGYDLYKLNHIKEAEEAINAALVITPKSASARLLYGAILISHKKYAEAEKTLIDLESSDASSSTPEVYWQLAILYNNTARNKQAVAELKKYLERQPNLPNKKEVEQLIEKLEKSNK